MTRLWIYVLVAVTLALVSTMVAQADEGDTSTSGGTDGSSLWLNATSRTGEDADGATETDTYDRYLASRSTAKYIEYRWTTVCVRATPNDSATCGVASTCPTPGEERAQLWGRTRVGSPWEPLATRCSSAAPANIPVPQPQVTPGLVLTELKRIGLPSLQAHTQPRDKTLVNFETIFYADPQPFTRTITLLGRSVDVEAHPTSFTWHYGDGTSTTTSTPGAPYPSKDVTHSYTDAHTTVQASVDVTYTARFRVGNGGWQAIPETVTILGPGAPLRISEATAVLSGGYE